MSESPWDALAPCCVKEFGDDVEGGGGDPAKVFVSVHYWRALINRSGLASLIRKEGNEWSSQAEGAP